MTIDLSRESYEFLKTLVTKASRTSEGATQVDLFQFSRWARTHGEGFDQLRRELFGDFSEPTNEEGLDDPAGVPVTDSAPPVPTKPASTSAPVKVEKNASISDKGDSQNSTGDQQAEKAGVSDLSGLVSGSEDGSGA